MFSCIRYKLGGDPKRNINKGRNIEKELLISKYSEQVQERSGNAKTCGNVNKYGSKEPISEKSRRDIDDNVDKDVTVDTDEGWYSRDVSDTSDYLSYQVRILQSNCFCFHIAFHVRDLKVLK